MYAANSQGFGLINGTGGSYQTLVQVVPRQGRPNVHARANTVGVNTLVQGMAHLNLRPSQPPPTPRKAKAYGVHGRQLRAAQRAQARRAELAEG